MLDVRPEHFTTNGNVAVPGNVSLAETQGRENLYGSMAAPAALDLTSSPCVNIGDAVSWAIVCKNVLFDDEGGGCDVSRFFRIL